MFDELLFNFGKSKFLKVQKSASIANQIITPKIGLMAENSYENLEI